MRTLFLPRAEAAVIRSVTSGDERIASWLMPRLTKDHFSFEPTAEFFRRIKFLTHKDGEIPRWEDLVDDMTIGQDAREELSTNPGEVISSRREARLLLDRLDKYRRARVLMDMSRAAARGLKSDRVDIDALQDELGELLSRSRGTGNMEESMFSFGGPKYDRTMIREILQDSRDEFIPTGFKAFDSENQGIPRGAQFLLAGSTGSGKTVFATNLGVNQSRIGAKVALVSLEMNRKETGRRVLSNLSNLPMQQINRVHEMSKADRQRLVDVDRDFQSQVRRNGGRFTIITPDDDVSIEDVLTLLRPRGYDNIIIDYVGLLKGLDGDDQWRQMGSVARVGKRFASSNNNIVTLLAQLSEEGVVRYSRTMQEHASLMWAFTRSQQDREAGTITVRQPKARNLKSFDFTLRTNYSVMRLEDIDASKTSSRRDSSQEPKVGKRGIATKTPTKSGEETPEYQL